MKIASIEPGDVFQGVNEQGFICFPNSYQCHWCRQGIHFNEATLHKRHVQALKENSVFFVLTESERLPFEAITNRYVRGLFDRFVTDFRCPKCKAPTVIIWGWSESADPQSRYTPVSVLVPGQWPEQGDAGRALGGER